MPRIASVITSGRRAARIHAGHQTSCYGMQKVPMCCFISTTTIFLQTKKRFIPATTMILQTKKQFIPATTIFIQTQTHFVPT